MVKLVHSQIDLAIDRIYDAAFDPDLWPEALHAIADITGARDAALGTMAPSGISWLIAPRTDPAFLETYADYHAEDRVWHETVSGSTGTIITDEMVSDPDATKRTAHYNDWLAPQGYRSQMGALLLKQEGWMTVIVLPGKTEFDKHARHMMEILSSHLKRAIHLQIRLDSNFGGNGLTLETMESAGRAVMIVDAGARPVFVSGAAEAWFKQGLRISGRRLAGESADATRALRTAIWRNAIAQPTSADEAIRLSARLSLSVARLRPGSPLIVPSQGVAVLTEAPHFGAQANIASRYGLSKAEAAFAIEITKGDGVRAAAERRGIAYGTARAHLLRIFEKTGVHTQAQLVRLILDE
jgi:DNA-binding CsgD family transcriptional regulator